MDRLPQQSTAGQYVSVSPVRCGMAAHALKEGGATLTPSIVRGRNSSWYNTRYLDVEGESGDTFEIEAYTALRPPTNLGWDPVDKEPIEAKLQPHHTKQIVIP